MQEKQRALLLDWGGTLMIEYPEYSGPMIDWPEVAPVPGAQETLKALHKNWILCLATNAEASTEEHIWAALDRAGLSQDLDKVYCYRKIGAKKPAGEFFDYILHDLGIRREDVVMVGDSYQADIQGALKSGLRGVWLNRSTPDERCGPGYLTIHDLSELQGALDQLLEDV